MSKIINGRIASKSQAPFCFCHFQDNRQMLLSGTKTSSAVGKAYIQPRLLHGKSHWGHLAVWMGGRYENTVQHHRFCSLGLYHGGS